MNVPAGRMTQFSRKQTSETEVLQLRRRLAKVHRILTAGGLWPLTKGHASARIPGTDKVLILGHIHATGRDLDQVDVDDIVVVNLDGDWLEGEIEPVDERFLHLEIMKKRPDVMAVVHTHSTYATAFGVADVNILPVGNRGAIFGPSVPILPFDRQIDSPERGQMAAECMGEGCAVVLKNHGVAVGSDTIENACITAFALEETAHLHWIAAQLGPVQRISTGEVHSVMTGARKAEFFAHAWGHYAKLDPWDGMNRPV